MRLVMACVALASACKVTEHFNLYLPQGQGPFAVGATGLVGVRSSTCMTLENQGGCDPNSVDIVRVTLEPEGVFEDTGDRQPIRLIARAEGETRITVVADDGDEKTFTQRLLAAVPDGVLLVPKRRGQPCATPARFTLGMTPELPFELRQGTTPLRGLDYLPFAVSNGMVQQTDEERVLPVRLTTAGPAVITSEIDPVFSVALEVIAPTAIDAITLGDPSTKDSFGRFTVNVDIAAGGVALCGDELSRTVKSETPEACLLMVDIESDTAHGELTATGLDSFVVTRQSQTTTSTCTVTVQLNGTAIAATRSYTLI